jgi:hypothetical protein
MLLQPVFLDDGNTHINEELMVRSNMIRLDVMETVYEL